jgi:hypothetical protein
MGLEYILLISLGMIVGIVLIIYTYKCLNETEEQKIIRKLKRHFDSFVNRLSTKHPNDERVIRLKNRYDRTKLFESESHETYTINKGEKVVMCLRDYSREKQLHDDFNLLVFVGLHELGHIMSISINHEKEFWDCFKFLLREAAEMNMYDPIDYSFDPVNYCAMVIDDNPYFYERTITEFMTQLNSLLVL